MNESHSSLRAMNLAEPKPSPALGAAGWISAAASVADAIHQLPAVATLDWCERAASGLTLVPKVLAAGTMICTVDESGRLMDLEAAGFAAAGTGPAREQQVRELRYGAEHLEHIGWSPSFAGLTFTPAVCAPLSSLPGAGSWRTGPMGRLLSEFNPDEVMVAACPLGQQVRGRCLLTIAIPADTNPHTLADIHAFMDVFAPALAARATRAIGAGRSKRNQWLSPREQLVLEMLTLGLSVRQIADELHRSPHTVHDHVKALHRKLSASSRGELVARALGYLGETDTPAARMARAEQMERTLRGDTTAPGVADVPEVNPC